MTRDRDLGLSLSSTVVLLTVVLLTVVLSTVVLLTVGSVALSLFRFRDPRPVVGIVFEGRMSAIYAR